MAFVYLKNQAILEREANDRESRQETGRERVGGGGFFFFFCSECLSMSSFSRLGHVINELIIIIM